MIEWTLLINMDTKLNRLRHTSYDINLDVSTAQLLWNRSIHLISVHTCKYTVKHFVAILQPLKMN